MSDTLEPKKFACEVDTYKPPIKRAGGEYLFDILDLKRASMLLRRMEHWLFGTQLDGAAKHLHEAMLALEREFLLKEKELLLAEKGITRFVEAKIGRTFYFDNVNPDKQLSGGEVIELLDMYAIHLGVRVSKNVDDGKPEAVRH